MAGWGDSVVRVFPLRQKGGYTDLGAFPYTVTPHAVRLTDRADGTKWWVTYNLTFPTADSQGYISITNAVPPQVMDAITYLAGEEPYFIGTAGVSRLIVRGGYLGADETPPAFSTSDQSNMKLYSIVPGFNAPMRQLILASTTDSKGKLYAWVPFTFVRTPNPT